MGATSELLGRPLMPWQQHVADVALELDPATGLLWYREIDLTVPRQSGKSTLLLAKNVHRATATEAFGPRQRLIYTAQTRNDAREKWEDDFVATLEASPAFRRRIKVIYSNGRERIRFQNGSTLGIDATTESSGHGPTIDGTDIDEAFSRVDNRTEQACRPAMITRPQPQLWVVSTGGWLGQSPYLWDKVTTGRALLELPEPTTRRAYFEWSAPQSADPGDEDVWRACMPALGYTITLDAIRQEFVSLGLREFQRAYLNMWVDQFAPDDEIIDLTRWDSLIDLDTGRLDPVAFGVHVTPDRTMTMIGVAGRRRDGLVQLELAAQQAGTDWAFPWLTERAQRWNPCAIVLDGTALALQATLADAGIDSVSTNSADRAQATVDLYDAVIPVPDTDGKATVRHGDDPLLKAALKVARKRVIGQRWVWDGEGVIGPLVAVTLAHHGLIAHGRPVVPPATPLLIEGTARVGDATIPDSHPVDLRSVRF
jgi:hypothetical protein